MTDLLAALDTAVAKLLEQAGLGEIKPEKIDATPAEAVKAFDSAMAYAKIRPTLVPKVKEESAFDAIQRGFHGSGAKTERRGRPPKDKAAPDPILNGEPPGSDLFNA
jgi:hypothetical protein